MLLGLVSLYTGLFGAGAKPTVVVSAVSGTFSLALAIAYVLQWSLRAAAVANASIIKAHLQVGHPSASST